MSNRTTISLRSYVPRQVMKWALTGVLLSSLFALLAVIYVGVVSTEDHLRIVGRAALKAFQPLIISGNVRHAELQMKDAMGLGTKEEIIVLDPKLQRYYSMGSPRDTGSGVPACTEPGKICWRLGQYRISSLVPIYFNDEKKDLFGYLQITLKPHVDFLLLGLLCGLILVGALLQAAGLSAKLIRLNTAIGERMSLWAALLQKDPKSRIPVDEVPFSELEPMRAALASLHEEVARLEKEARHSASLAVIRGIAHDILSPVSQLRKLTAVLERSRDQPEEFRRELMSEIDRALRRLGYIANQTKLIQQSSQPVEPLHPSDVICNLTRELSSMIDDLKTDPEVMKKQIVFELRTDPVAPITGTVIPGDCQRILDNLIRNAVQASPERGRIALSLSREGTFPRITICDQGPGIPEPLRERIFDLDFSTKPGVGTGLGLAIVRQLCTKNAAQVDFQSQIGIGTEFHVTFQPAEPGVAV